MRGPFGPILLAALSCATVARGAEALEERLAPLIRAHEGEVAVCVKHLGTGESFRSRADAPMPTASLIKLPVMIEAYRQAESRAKGLDIPVVLRRSDMVPGSGLLTTHFSDGATFSLRDAVHLMIAASDNTATNLVLDQIGLDATARTMEAMGCPNTKIHSKVYRRDTSIFPDRSRRFGLGSTTADEMVLLLESLANGTAVSPGASGAMLAHLRACDDADKFPRFLPPGTPLAFKTGSVDDIRTAAGLLDTPEGRVALCVLTEKNRDRRYAPDNAGNLLCANVAREVFLRFGGKPSTSPAP